MTDPARRPERRSEDTRLSVLERDLQRLLEDTREANKKLDRMSDTLISIQAEPEQFPAGRALLRRADANKGRLDKHDAEIRALEKDVDERFDKLEAKDDERFKRLEAKDQQRDGVVNFLRIVQTILGIAVALLTIGLATGRIG